MSDRTTFAVELDDSVKGSDTFNSLTEFSLEKPDIFKYGVLNLEPPKDKIKEYDFEYFESKVPYLFGLYEDFIHLEQSTVYNYAESETARSISEIIGVGVGLYYVIRLFNIMPNAIRKIPPPSGQGKYLDFSFHKDDRKYEYEAKGTTNENKVSQRLDEIKAKKKGKPDTACRFGTVVLARKFGESKKSRFAVCDEYEDKPTYEDNDIYHYWDYYRFILSLILDNTQYNKLMRQISKKKVKTRPIIVEELKGHYKYEGRIYVGQYFDKRLILDKIRENYYEGMGLDPLFRRLTQNIGREKYFLGLDEKTIDALNSADLALLGKPLERKIIETEDFMLAADSDGIVFARSRNKADSQIEENFTEEDVKARIEMLNNYGQGNKHKCGAPCRSREKEGKPCEIMTYRDNCHFHR